MAVALPRLMRDLHVTADAVQWLTTAFLLTMSVIIPVTGFLLQRINTRPVFILAMSLFSLGTLIATSPPISRCWSSRASFRHPEPRSCPLPLLMTTVMTLSPGNSLWQDHGLHHHRHIGGTRQSAPPSPASFSIISAGAGCSCCFQSPLARWRWAPAASRPTTLHHAALDGISVVLSGFAFGGIVYGLSNIGVAAAPGNAAGWRGGAGGAVLLVVYPAPDRAAENRLPVA